MATASELISNKGDANLGLGSNPDVPVSSSNDMGVINDAAKNMELLNHDNNIQIFKQKVADRDKMYSLLDSGIIPSGDIEDKDRPYYDKAEKDVMDAFHKIKGINDTDAIEEFNKKAANLKDVVTHAQGRHLSLVDLRTQQSQQTLKSKQDAYGDHIKDQEAKPFESMIDPYQQALDFDKDHYKTFLTGALSGTNPLTATTDKTTTTNKGGVVSTTNTESTTNPSKTKGQDVVGSIIYKDGLPYSRTSQYYDFGKIRQQAAGDYLNPKGEGLEQQNMLRGYLESSDDSVVQPILSHIITRLGDYNNDRGLQKGDPGYIDVDNVKKQWGYDPATDQFKRNPQTGKIQFGTSTPDLNAYWALASVDGSYAPNTDVFLKDEANQTEKERHDKATEAIGWEKAKAYADLLKFKLSTAKTDATKDQVLDDMYTRNYLEVPNLVESRAGKDMYGFSNIKADQSLPMYTIDGNKAKLLKPIGATPVWDRPKSGDASLPADAKAKVIAWKGGVYKPEYLVSGRPQTPQEINDIYLRFKKQQGDKWKGGIDDWMRQAIQNGKFDVKTVGEDGSTDKTLNTEALRLITNQGTKKDQVNVFAQDQDNPPVDETDNTSTSGSSSSSGE